MKKLIYIIIVFTVTIWAESNEYNCNTPSTPNTNPEGSCEQYGFICNLGFNVKGENDILFFNLGKDATCSVLLQSRFRTRIDSSSNVYSNDARFTLTENEYYSTSLSLSLASSLALFALNNGLQVDIIYTQDHDIHFNGIRILSIKLMQ